jgi:diaminopimelate decarboxylase
MSIGGEFTYTGGSLLCEGVNLSRVAADHGTPAYVYSKAAIRGRFHEYEDALRGVSHRVCFAVKANSNLAVLSVLAAEGAGFDIVSGGELYRVLAAGGDASSVVFSGVGKTDAEIRYALDQKIHSFNCESEPEIELISRISQSMGQIASIAIRVNPDVDAATHPYISTGLREHKFGVDIAQAEAIYQHAASLPGIAVEGVSCHIGSQLLTIAPVLEAADKVLALVKRLRANGLPIRNLDLGGGLGVPYQPGQHGTPIREFIEHLRPKLESLDLTLMLEPGRSIVAEAGVLLSRVLLVKKNGEKTFVILDAAMNDLIRPALYQAYHEIVPVEEHINGERMQADVVGPVCETGDFFARDRELPALKEGDLVAIRTAGAYGFVLASNYNSRPRVCELLVDGSRIHVARERETYADLIRGESPVSPAVVHTDIEHDRAARNICPRLA